MKLIDTKQLMFYRIALLLHSFFSMEISKPIETTDVDLNDVSLTQEQCLFMHDCYRFDPYGASCDIRVPLMFAFNGLEVPLNVEAQQQDILHCEKRFVSEMRYRDNSFREMYWANRLVTQYIGVKLAGLPLTVPVNIRELLLQEFKLLAQQGDMYRGIVLMLDCHLAILGLKEFNSHTPSIPQHQSLDCLDVSDLWKFRLLGMETQHHLSVLTPQVALQLRNRFAEKSKILEQSILQKQYLPDSEDALMVVMEARLLSAKTLRLLPEGLEVDGQLVVIPKIRPSIEGNVQQVSDQTRTDVGGVL